MPNYSLKFGTSEVAKMFAVDKAIIKTWAYKFCDYLSSDANPAKGKVRQFVVADIHVFAYVFAHWERSPDIESIKIGLNSNDHLESPYTQFAVLASPLFRELPPDIDETWKGMVFGGEFALADTFTLADSYKLAGDKLVEFAYNNEVEKELFYPAIYNYRHATELYLKAIIGKERKSHDLLWLLKEFKALINKEFDDNTPEWIDNVIIVFNDFDPYGTIFRYGGDSPKDEMFADMLHVKSLMEYFTTSLKAVADSLERRGMKIRISQ